MRLYVYNVSTFRTIIFGNNIFAKSKKQNVLELNGAFLKKLWQMKQKLENAFLVEFSIFFWNFHDVQKWFLKFFSSMHASEYSATADITYRR